MLDTILRHIDDCKDELIELQRRMVAIPALGPDNGGDGERAKADFLTEYMKNFGIGEVVELNAPDNRVPAGHRPNLAAIIPGQDVSRTMWIIGHMDVVPPGEDSMWDGDPYELRVEGDLMFGRGVEDNHQGIVMGLMLARALAETKTIPPINLGLLLVADEETGSEYGLDYVVKNHSDRFSRNDLFMVPDFGVPDSSLIEVAEKSMFWLKIKVTGKQCHASTPHQGVNSLVAASALVLKLDGLHQLYPATDELFQPSASTFVPTKKEANVPNVNTLPGSDVFYLDSRILPQYPVDDVLESVKTMGREIEKEYGVALDYEVIQREDAAPPTPADSEVATRLASGIRAVYEIEPRPAGVGGGTVAAFLRRKGFEAAVWHTSGHMAHQPNESASISNQIKDAKVMAHALWGE